jgi:hypothetical protein
MPRPGRFTPGKETRYILYRRLGGPQGRSRGVRNISPPPRFVVGCSKCEKHGGEGNSTMWSSRIVIKLN